jgi:hypothetical protein
VPWFAAGLLLLGCLGVAAAWVSLALLGGRQCGWMATLAALDAAWLLRLGGAAPGPGRMLAGVAGTALTVGLANWGIIAAHLAGAFGLEFIDSALRLGPALAWTLAGLANGPVELAWLLAALLLAALATR